MSNPSISIEYFENKIKSLKSELLKTKDTNKQNEIKANISLCKASIRNLQLDDSLDKLLLPEYRKDGYFESEEFKNIEEEVLNDIYNKGISSSKEIVLLEKEILKNKYNIDWLPYEERFIKGVETVID